MRYFKIKCGKCGGTKRIIFNESNDKEIQRDLKIGIINGEEWVDNLPPLTDFCLGDCSGDSNLIGGRSLSNRII